MWGVGEVTRDELLLERAVLRSLIYDIQDGLRLDMESSREKWVNDLALAEWVRKYPETNVAIQALLRYARQLENVADRSMWARLRDLFA